MRLIDADALEKVLTEKFQTHYGDTVYQFIHDFFRCLVRLIRKAPTIEAEPVRHGRWETHNQVDSVFYCSECKLNVSGFERRWLNYCPNCGAKMDKENEK